MKSLKFAKFNRRALNAALASALALAGTGFVGSAYAAAASSTATATVSTPIAIAATAQVLSFGKFIPTGAGTTVTISNSGARTGSATFPAITGTLSAAKFNVSGDASVTYSITHTALTALTGISGAALTGPQTMALAKTSDLTGDNATTGNVASGTLTSAGTQSIYVGGTLTVGISQAAGVYTGSVGVTVEYN